MNPKTDSFSNPIRRRDFFRQSACTALGVTGVVNTLANLRLMTAALAQNTPSNDYRALVCLFLNGGNDSNNLLVPRSGEFRNDYEIGRGVLQIPSEQLHPIRPLNEGRDFGLHPNAAPLQQTFNDGKLAFVCNVGSLAYPIATREEYINKTVPLPPQLFSHSDQQTQWQSSIPDQPFQSGWGGRIADLLNASKNPDSKVSMSISLSGINSFQIGTSGDVTQFVTTPNGVSGLSGYGKNYQNALNDDGSYKRNDPGKRLKAFEEIMDLTNANLMEDAYNKVVRRARDSESTVGATLQTAERSGVAFDELFINAQSSLGDQLKTVAKLIAGRAALGNRRQIFFCRVGGYDTHQSQMPSHANLTAELATAMRAFYQTTAAMGMQDNITTFTCSDFARTFTPNGTDANAGADHAWGGHAMVMGGAVKGQRLYGQFPELLLGAGDDAGRNRGRWIPTTSVDQYASVLARWFGVDSNSMESIFPNLPRFDDPLSSSRPNLDFMAT
ncbi:DUF1501 domain-containing protein [bacterium]|jgi:uncharacterized protein (DUF1501 family)|nr:DUF1501 domain-containing protein [Verrucomicrobiota bacterium]MDA7680192.1 DUF1501 domain-containing protein [bacterium]